VVVDFGFIRLASSSRGGACTRGAHAHAHRGQMTIDLVVGTLVEPATLDSNKKSEIINQLDFG
jgi:hypothetical protein